MNIYHGREAFRPPAIEGAAKEAAVAAPTTAPDGEGSEGLGPASQRLLRLPSRVASWLWDFKGEGEKRGEKTTFEYFRLKRRM